jgi:uncharacterized membrane protein
MSKSGFFSKIFKKDKKEDSQQMYEKALSERNTLKAEIAESLKEINFTDQEIQEVISIINHTESKINSLKEQLNPDKIEKEFVNIKGEIVSNQIDKLIEQMNKDMIDKIQSIKAKK